MSNSRDGIETDQQPPLEYITYVWRKRMKVSYNEMLVTPMSVILQDLEMSGLEDKYGKKKAE